LYRKSYGSGLWIMGPRLALGPWWTRDHGAVRSLRGSRGHRDSSERERKLFGFSPMTLYGGRVAEMTARWRSIEAVGGAPMGRWFWCEEERLESRWVRWIMGVLSSCLFIWS
jgi:hypothetical protein